MVSLSAHYSGIYTDMNIKYTPDMIYESCNLFAPLEYPYYMLEDSHVEDVATVSEETKFNFIRYMFESNVEAKIVLIDENGDIIRQSENFVIKQNEQFLFRDIIFDADTNKIEVEYFDDLKRHKQEKKFLVIIYSSIFFIIIILIILPIYISWKTRKKSAN